MGTRLDRQLVWAMNLIVTTALYIIVVLFGSALFALLLTIVDIWRNK